MTDFNTRLCLRPEHRYAYSCARCHQSYCMDCDRPKQGDGEDDLLEHKTIVRWCSHWMCERERAIENGELQVLRKGDALVQENERLKEDARNARSVEIWKLRIAIDRHVRESREAQETLAKLLAVATPIRDMRWDQQLKSHHLCLKFEALNKVVDALSPPGVLLVDDPAAATQATTPEQRAKIADAWSTPLKRMNIVLVTINGRERECIDGWSMTYETIADLAGVVEPTVTFRYRSERLPFAPAHAGEIVPGDSIVARHGLVINAINTGAA